MSSYENLLEETIELRRALSQTRELLERSRQDNDQLKKMHEDHKLYYEHLKKECNEYQQRYVDAVNTKKEIEIAYEQQMKRFKSAFENKQREFEEMKSQMIPPLDQDLLRVKLINEIEAPHKQILEQKEQEVSKLQDEISKLQRQLEIKKSKLETLQSDYEGDIQKVKEDYRSQIADLTKEIEILNEKLEDVPERDQARLYKRENDKLKVKYEDLLYENEELRKLNEVLKTEKSEQQIQFSRQIESETSAKRQLQIRIDKMQIQLTEQQEQNLKQIREIESLKSQLFQINNSKDENYNQLNVQMEQIAYLKEQVNTLKEEMLKKDNEFVQRIRSTVDQEQEKLITEKNEVNRCLKKIEILESYKKNIENSKSDFEKMCRLEANKFEKECRVLNEEKVMLQNRLTQIQNEAEKQHRYIQHLNQEKTMYEKEVTKLQESYRTVMQSEHTLKVKLEHLEISENMRQKDLENLNQRCQEQDSVLRNMTIELEDYKRKYDLISKTKETEVLQLKKKVQKNKSKVKKANEIIRYLQTKFQSNMFVNQPRYRLGVEPGPIMKSVMTDAMMEREAQAKEQIEQLKVQQKQMNVQLQQVNC